MVDHHLVADLLPALGLLCFRGRIAVKLSLLQAAIVLGLALQRKDVGEVAKELDLPAAQALALYGDRSLCVRPSSGRCPRCDAARRCS